MVVDPDKAEIARKGKLFNVEVVVPKLSKIPQVEMACWQAKKVAYFEPNFEVLKFR